MARGFHDVSLPRRRHISSANSAIQNVSYPSVPMRRCDWIEAVYSDIGGIEEPALPELFSSPRIAGPSLFITYFEPAGVRCSQSLTTKSGPMRLTQPSTSQ